MWLLLSRINNICNIISTTKREKMLQIKTFKRNTSISLLLMLYVHTIIVTEITAAAIKNELNNHNNSRNNNKSDNINIKTLSAQINAAVNRTENGGGAAADGGISVNNGAYLEKLDSLERSVAAVLIKVAYGTTSTTKRSIPDNYYVSSLTTVATPLLTTIRQTDKISHLHQANFHHRNYELDLERDHALPTSAPNADILKSNSNPTYPNPNKHGGLERGRHRHYMNSTPATVSRKNHLVPGLINGVAIGNNGHSYQLLTPTIPMYVSNGNKGEIGIGDVSSHAQPAVPQGASPPRAFFTPPLPPEYQSPFADKPTLRGTNNDMTSVNNDEQVQQQQPQLNNGYINRRPIPPPSLMPGHERVPIRPPDLTVISNNNNNNNDSQQYDEGNGDNGNNDENDDELVDNKTALNNLQPHQAVLPAIRRILSGTQHRQSEESEIPEVLLKHVTKMQEENEPQDKIAEISTTTLKTLKNIATTINAWKKSHINSNNNYNHINLQENQNLIITTTMPPVLVNQQSNLTATSTNFNLQPSTIPSNSIVSSSSNSASSSLPSYSSSLISFSIAWHIHIYLCLFLFTILLFLSIYKLFLYNKLNYLFSHLYFITIHFIIILICVMRIFYLYFDGYNLKAKFSIFLNELLLNLPGTLITVNFAILILYLFLCTTTKKQVNNGGNQININFYRYSAIIRPLTVAVAASVHILLCLTLHYVEAYTIQQQQQQHLLLKKHQQFMQQQQQQPAKILSLICQIIYTFVCFTLSILYIYIYRLLKRHLQQKSQQHYIHGQQHLNYAIHITIAIALLYILLAALQIFGIITIATTTTTTNNVFNQNIMKNNLQQSNDWLSWGYQFSLRLIEIAILTLISWVTGLKTTPNANAAGLSQENHAKNYNREIYNPVTGLITTSTGTDSRLNAQPQVNRYNRVGGLKSSLHVTTAELNAQPHKQNIPKQQGNFINAFLSKWTKLQQPSSSSHSSSQVAEFDDSQQHDYPTICVANTNLHQYTMRTGKLVYNDDNMMTTTHPQQQQQYDLCYDMVELQQSQLPLSRQQQYLLQQSALHEQQNYNLTDVDMDDEFQEIVEHNNDIDDIEIVDDDNDVNVDHYENPNFDLNTSAKRNKYLPTTNNSTTASAASSIGGIVGNVGGSSASSTTTSHKQMLLQSMQLENCYSEPIILTTSNNNTPKTPTPPLLPPLNSIERRNYLNQQQQLDNLNSIDSYGVSSSSSLFRKQRFHQQHYYPQPQHSNFNSLNMFDQRCYNNNNYHLQQRQLSALNMNSSNEELSRQQQYNPNLQQQNYGSRTLNSLQQQKHLQQKQPNDKLYFMEQPQQFSNKKRKQQKLYNDDTTELVLIKKTQQQQQQIVNTTSDDFDDANDYDGKKTKQKHCTKALLQHSTKQQKLFNKRGNNSINCNSPLSSTSASTSTPSTSTPSSTTSSTTTTSNTNLQKHDVSGKILVTNQGFGRFRSIDTQQLSPTNSCQRKCKNEIISA